MKEKLLNNLTKDQMRKALKKLGVHSMDKKPLHICRKRLDCFSYNNIIEALK